ncbi:MAG: DUF3226 domain-containing protein [Nannocystaceae bacterium]
MTQRHGEPPLLESTTGRSPTTARRAAVLAAGGVYRRFVDAHRSKAVVHTWLAWQRDPGTPLGHATTMRYLDPSRTPAPQFRTWLVDLFG